MLDPAAELTKTFAKPTAARTCVGAANVVAKEMKRKPWRYALIPHDAVTEAATLTGLVKTYGMAEIGAGGGN